MNPITLFFSLMLILLLAPSALSDDCMFKYGLGILDGSRTAQIKNLSLRTEGLLGLGNLYQSKEVGLWTDTGKAESRSGSVYVQWQMGIKPQSQHIYAKAFWGVALLSSKDSLLGGRTQFVQDAGAGFQDDYSSVGVFYKHISSAGIHKPNKGRDFVGLEMGLRF